MSRMAELAMEMEIAQRCCDPVEDEVGRDVTKLVSVTSDLVLASRHVPDLVARDWQMIHDAHDQLGRMLSRLHGATQ